MSRAGFEGALYYDVDLTARIAFTFVRCRYERSNHEVTAITKKDFPLRVLGALVVY